MKKILIGILVILFIVLLYFTLTKGISIGEFKISSISDIKNKSKSLDQSLTESNELTKKTYPSKLEEIDIAIKNLNVSKEKYEAKMEYTGDETSLGVVQVKSYKVEFLWIIIENYAKEQGLKLKMDIEDRDSANKIYNLNFTLTGSYISITDFIYSIENDEDLKFKIKNLVILSTGSNSTTNTATNSGNNNTSTLGNSIISNRNNTSTNSTINNTTTDYTKTNESDKGITLDATFTVENIGIEGIGL